MTLKKEVNFMFINMDKLNKAFELINDGVLKGDFPGAVAAVGNKEGIIKVENFGSRCLYPEKLPMSKDTLFDLASLTKVVATNTLFMIFLEKGLISVYDSVDYYLSEFKGTYKENVTIFNLLTHTAGFVPFKPLYELCSNYEDAIGYICWLELDYKPGTRCIYSDFSYILLGYILEKIGGARLNVLCKNIFLNLFKWEIQPLILKGII
ncbi:serine hydrolase domain-containing protein [Clostridium sp. DMHC 10]|uniref:serine hydrolase domain-containing protein n=1 Tax=Clostridium sp. DMHC 10 TaxID=747377 RepID=UPI001FA74E51|nr:serine hydrolase domain-containing protein [Clostridium sp. DMHC 10]